ncbi:MAG TPA: hypothetical protein VGB94_03850 [Acidobacteriaceae bacterium]
MLKSRWINDRNSSLFCFRLMACIIAVGLFVSLNCSAQDAAKDLYDFGDKAELARIDPAHAEFSSVDAHTLKVDFDNQGAYPGITLAPPGGAKAVWDLSKYAGIQATVTNKSSVAIRIALRADNPGDFRLNHLNSTSVRFLPGETKQVQLTFGLADGKPGYELDGAQVSKIIIFAVKPTVPVTAIITKLTGFGTHAEAVAARASLLAAARAAKLPANPPTTGALVDYSKNAELARLNPQHAEFSAVEGKKLKIDLSTDGTYPGITIPAPTAGWNLSQFAGIQVEITNQGKVPVRMDLLAGGQGDWGQDVANNAMGRVMPGETKMLQLTFGTDYGNPGVALDTARISRVLIFGAKPTEPVSIEIGPIIGFGTPSAPTASK